jgi:hypothetical protein
MTFDPSKLTAAYKCKHGFEVDGVAVLCSFCKYEDRIVALEAENAQLRAALTKYGVHVWSCPRSGHHRQACLCGLEAALAKVKP